ncbi:MAG: FAD-dependent oxidoreductase [Syntrophales bacterium]|nr:FAD-dependent oxidoreductase [Syntrophales bacterium]
MWQFDSVVGEVIRRTPSVKSFRFPIRAKGVRYRAGQFFFLTIKVHGEDAVHHFSFSSSPTDKGYIEFTKRITANDFSQALDLLKPGDWANLRDPGGTFTLSRKYSKLAFLSGGIGITPLRSMIRYVVHKKLPYDIVLLYSNNSVEEIIFREELDKFSSDNPHLRVEHILSGDNLPAGWKGKTGLINRDLVAELVPDYGERLFYISGPPKMVITLEQQLSGLNLAPEQIRRDSFTGYD